MLSEIFYHFTFVIFVGEEEPFSAIVDKLRSEQFEVTCVYRSSESLRYRTMTELERKRRCVLLQTLQDELSAILQIPTTSCTEPSKAPRSELLARLLACWVGERELSGRPGLHGQPLWGLIPRWIALHETCVMRLMKKEGMRCVAFGMKEPGDVEGGCAWRTNRN
jgi:hypothetical protein